MVQSLIDTDGARHPRTLSYCHTNIIPRPVSISIHHLIISIIHLPTYKSQKYKYTLYLTSDRKSLDFYRVLFKHGRTNDLHMLVFIPREPRDHVTKVPNNSYKPNAEIIDG